MLKKKFVKQLINILQKVIMNNVIIFSYNVSVSKNRNLSSANH